MTKAEDATTESTTSKEYKDDKSSDNVLWIDEEKYEGMVPMVRKDQRKSENVDEEYENLSEVVNMKHNCIDGTVTSQVRCFRLRFNVEILCVAEGLLQTSVVFDGQGR